uniref:Uncharacterized protein n=1 Tax=Anguilla anguilla TaxID=7936 RepID=A0A0E9V2P3_ANGAN
MSSQVQRMGFSQYYRRTCAGK